MMRNNKTRLSWIIFEGLLAAKGYLNTKFLTILMDDNCLNLNIHVRIISLRDTGPRRGGGCKVGRIQ